jgi:plastocyanin
MRRTMINILKRSHDERCQREHPKCSKNHNSSVIDFSRKRNYAKRGIPETFMTFAGQVRRNARMCSRGFSGSHVVKIGNIHSFEFIRVNRSGVVSPRSWSRPRVDLLRSNQEIHGVSGLNRINIAPTNSNFLKGVCDNNALVEESDFGSKEQQEGDVAEKKIENQSAYFGFKATFVEIRTGDTNTEKKDTDSIHEITSRSKNLSVGHLDSFSWKIERSAA